MKLSTLWSSRKNTDPVYPGMSMTELLEGYDLLEVHDEPGKEFAVVVPKVKHLTREIGSASPSPFTSFTRSEYNPLLRGLAGLEIYDKMRKSDGVVKGTLRGAKIPVLSTKWYCHPPMRKTYGRNKKKQANEIAEFLWWNLTEGMSISWTQFLSEALLCCDFGYYMFELVWENRIVNGKLRTVLKKLAPRHPMDVKEWVKDVNGGPVGVWMYVATETGGVDEKFIPIRDLLIFTHDREADNIEGVSVLRSAYKHWYYKEQLYKIDAIQKERHGIGIPVIVLPLGFKPDDKVIADELGRNIRTNEKAHIVLPPGWEISMLKLEGQPVNALESVDVHDEAIRENMLMKFAGKDGTTNEQDLNLYLLGASNISDIVSETINLYLVPRMVKFNWPMWEDMPKIKCRKIGDENRIRTLTFALRNLAGAGLIMPDDALEAWLRNELDLPEMDIETRRDVMGIFEDDSELDDPNTTPPKQQGGRAGLPRQTNVNRQRQGAGANGGVDRSGGK